MNSRRRCFYGDDFVTVTRAEARLSGSPYMTFYMHEVGNALGTGKGRARAGAMV